MKYESFFFFLFYEESILNIWERERERMSSAVNFPYTLTDVSNQPTTPKTSQYLPQILGILTV